MLRESRGWTLRQLAEISEVGMSALAHIERGRSLPSVLTLDLLASAFGVSMDDLWKGVEIDGEIW